MPSQTFTSTTTWTAPAGVYEVDAEVWGGGGSGTCATFRASGGGGGGYAKKRTISVTPGNSYTVHVGSGGARQDSKDVAGNAGGDSWFLDVSTVYATGGGAGQVSNSTASGGSAGNGTIGDFLFSGGSGGTRTTNGGTGGGGGAGDNGNGTSVGTNVTSGGSGGAGIITTGGNGGNYASNPTPGGSPGGGGGPTNSGSSSGAAGGGGLIILTYGTSHISNLTESISLSESVSVLMYGGSKTESFVSSTTWVCPSFVTSVDVEVWGGGGGGGGSKSGPTVNDNPGGAGGGGGAYSKKLSISVTPGNYYTVNVGSGGTGTAGADGSDGGDSWFIDSSTVLAKGGKAGTNSSTGVDIGVGGAGGLASGGIGDTKFSGGSGGNGSHGSGFTTGGSGGGGGGAGTLQDGGNATAGTAGFPGTVGSGGAPGSGIGGIGATGVIALSGQGIDGNSGGPAGAGGSGASTFNNFDPAYQNTGGSGAHGQVSITYLYPTISVNDSLTISEHTQIDYIKDFVVSDTISMSEDVNIYTLGNLQFEVDQITITEFVNLVPTINISVADQISISESYPRQEERSFLVTENVTISEYVTLESTRFSYSIRTPIGKIVI